MVQSEGSGGETSSSTTLMEGMYAEDSSCAIQGAVPGRDGSGLAKWSARHYQQRLIGATALVEGAGLVTHDREVAKSGLVPVIW